MGFDIVIRYCGHGEWLPIIKDGNGTELYRGDRHTSHDDAFAKAMKVFDTGGTQNIVDFQNEHPELRDVIER